MSKQTALDWYFEKNTELDNSFDEQEIDILEYVERKKEIQDQAKQMEKEQTISAVKYGCSDWGSAKDAEHYFNETYGGQDE